MYGGDIEDCINWGYIKGLYQIGGIAGDSDGINGDGLACVSGCTNYGDVIYENELDSKDYASFGGIVGCNWTNSKVEDCSNFGNVIGGYRCVGGILGSSDGYLSGSMNEGKIEGDIMVGGLVGQLCKNGKIENCTNKGEFKGNDKIGEIVGENLGSEDNIKNSRDEFNN